MKTSIIIWTCNQLPYLMQAVAGVREHTKAGDYELLVIDDHSTDGTTEWLSRQDDLRIIRTEHFRGYAAGCNQAMLQATGDSIVLLDCDVVVTHRWLENLTACLYSEDTIGAVAPVTNRGDYGQTIAVGYQNQAEMHSYAQKHNVSNPDLWEERIKLSGYCLMIKQRVAVAAGFFDEALGEGYLTDDYTFRLRLQGWRLMLCWDTFVQHGNIPHGGAMDYRELLERFTAKWGFNPVYSAIARLDIAGLIENPRTQQLCILEVGCACGATLMKIKNNYPQARLYGIELNEKAAASAALFAEVTAADVETMALPYPKEYFDYIIFADVLEHLTDPWRALEQVRAYLKPGGQILASIPNVMHFTVLRGLLQGCWTYEAAGILDKTHLRFFTGREIAKLFQTTGYNLVSCHSNFIGETAADQQLILALAAVAGNSRFPEQCRTYQYIVRAAKPASLPVLRPAAALQPNKFCFITCEQADAYPNCLAHLAKLDIPAGYEMELINVTDCVSMASAYNQALAQSDAKYKVFLQPDVFILNRQFMQDLLRLFANPKIGMVGMAGCASVPANGIWWEASHRCGKVFDSHTGQMEQVELGEVTDEFQEVEYIDGLLMATQYDLSWREDLFNGWHFYDGSQSMEFIRAGYKVVVPRQTEPWCMHDCGVIGLTQGYHDYRQLFIDTYLPGKG